MLAHHLDQGNSNFTVRNFYSEFATFPSRDFAILHLSWVSESVSRIECLFLQYLWTDPDLASWHLVVVAQHTKRAFLFDTNETKFIAKINYKPPATGGLAGTQHGQTRTSRQRRATRAQHTWSLGPPPASKGRRAHWSPGRSGWFENKANAGAGWSPHAHGEVVEEISFDFDGSHPVPRDAFPL